MMKGKKTIRKMCVYSLYSLFLSPLPLSPFSFPSLHLFFSFPFPPPPFSFHLLPLLLLPLSPFPLPPSLSCAGRSAMATIGRATQATTSAGDDEQHRMRVDRKYDKLSALKPRLRQALAATSVFYVVSAGLMAWTYSQTSETYLHPAVFLGSLLQFIAYPALKKNAAAPLVAFSTLCGLVAAYLLYAGVGRTITVMEIKGVAPFSALILVVNALGCFAHLAAVYYARMLIENMKIGVTRPKKKD
eukprot:m.190345 g.190345  ORF g.190345 m.190345 type:complete len:244 (-) comp16756_c0_seq4:94-825(-)